ncbi:MAG: U32 family peptidase [Pygmaiobacter sp.]
MQSLPELLLPAGDMERLNFALSYGADAVYLGADRFGMRTSPKTFTIEQLTEAAALTHSKGKRLYLTLNAVLTNDEVRELPEFLCAVRTTGMDAFIVADIGVLALCKRYAPEIELHLSTQVGIMNYETANAAYALGAKRVVLARELTLQDIAVIRENTPPELELETFVHGAMCMSFSGRCLLSQYLAGRDGNRGACAQPCRWEYSLVEKHRAGQQFDIGENEEGAYILNADDLCTAPFLDLILAAGVNSLKVEGRAKSFYYVASLAAAYRRALDAVLADPTGYACPEETIAELGKTSHRHYSPGFYFGREHATQNTTTSSYIREWEVLAVVDSCAQGVAQCTQRGRFWQGDEVELLLPSGDTLTWTPSWLRNELGEEIGVAPHSMMKFSMPVPQDVPPLSILRKKAAAPEQRNA